MEKSSLQRAKEAEGRCPWEYDLTALEDEEDSNNNKLGTPLGSPPKKKLETTDEYFIAATKSVSSAKAHFFYATGSAKSLISLSKSSALIAEQASKVAIASMQMQERAKEAEKEMQEFIIDCQRERDRLQVELAAINAKLDAIVVNVEDE